MEKRGGKKKKGWGKKKGEGKPLFQATLLLSEKGKGGVGGKKGLTGLSVKPAEGRKELGRKEGRKEGGKGAGLCLPSRSRTGHWQQG